MLVQLATDIQALANDVPAMQAAAAAIAADLANPAAVNLQTLATDAAILQTAAEALATDATKVAADLSAMPQGTQTKIDWQKLLAAILALISALTPPAARV